jgi:DNA-binding SARP family transcriptional activator
MLELRFLGEVEVRRKGAALVLPPSKKTRALLAYLALTARPMRRDHLCELLWDLPDDPRGSLRWSLSKLRRLVDDDGHARIRADRSQVSFDAEGVEIDVSSLLALVEKGLDRIPTERLEVATARYQGNLLEGLELTQHHAFYAWCVSERDRVASAQALLLRTLVERLADQPVRALPYARSLVVRSPYDEALRADLIRLLVRAGHVDEADQQLEMGRRVLQEVGTRPRGLLVEARHDTAPQPVAAGSEAPARQRPPVRTDSRRDEMLATGPADTAIGRDPEIALIRESVEALGAGAPARFLLVQGEPGIGKSHLLGVAEELARGHGAHLLRASAFESEAIRPFALWIDALRRIDQHVVEEVFGAEERRDREQLFDGLTRAIARASEERPVVLLFDDLHWCDESSAAALQYVARMNRDRPMLGILAAREEELNDNAAVLQALRGLRRDKLLSDVRLGPLSDAAIDVLISESAAGVETGLDGRTCRGNPLLAIELARSQRDAGQGGSLIELVRERLSSLDLEGADVLRWAAILSPRIDSSGLSRVTGLDSDRIGRILESAERLSLLVPGERGLCFSHDLVARSIYQDIAPSRRRVMHARVAELLEQSAAVDLDRAADLAHHASLSGDALLAARAMVLAGRLCLRFFANDDALSLATRGLRWAESLPDAERVRLTLELRDVELAAAPLDDWEAAAKDYVALAERALDYGALAHARLGYHMASYVRWIHGQWSHAREETLQAERVVRGASEQDHVIGLAETAKCLAMLERDLAQADAMLMEAGARADRIRLRHHAIPAARGMLCFHRKELDTAEELFLEARTLCKSAGDRIDEFLANEYLVMIELERGRSDAALARCAALREIGEKLREGSEAPCARALTSLCRYALEGDESGLDAAFEELRMVDAKHRLAYGLTRAALLDVDRGRIDRAIERAGEAADCARVLERATDIVLAHVALAAAHRARGDVASAASQLEAIERVDPARVARWALDRARAMGAAQSRQEA